MAQADLLKSVPDGVVLPMASAKPRALDWNHKKRLTAHQLLLLQAFEALNFSRKAQLLHGMGESDGIPAHKIKMLFDEQMRENSRGADAGALRDTTQSDLA